MANDTVAELRALENDELVTRLKEAKERAAKKTAARGTKRRAAG